MKYSTCIALVLLMGALCLGAIEAKRITFTKNVTLEVHGGKRDRDFEFRKIVEFDWPWAEGFISYNVSKNKSDEGVEIERDLIVNVAACLPNTRPAFAAAAIESNRSINGDYRTWTTDTFNASANFLAGTYGSLCEKDEDGNNVVGPIDFDEFDWVRDDPEDPNNNDNAADGIFTTTFLGTHPNVTNASISITFMAANKVGETDLANAVLTPRSFSSAITISNWSYADTSNHLEVTIFAATAGMEYDSSKTRKRINSFTWGKDASQVYYMINKKAKCNGEVKPIEIKGWKKCEDKNLFKNILVKTIMELRYNLDWEVYNNTVIFEPNVTEAEHSCGCGAGPSFDLDEDSDDNASMFVLPSVILLVVLLIFIQ